MADFDIDADGDQHLASQCGGDDCDDDDASIHPGAPEAVWDREVVDESNFFDHGGHSLSAMRVVSGIRESEGIELGLADLFENPTPRRLAEMIRAPARH